MDTVGIEVVDRVLTRYTGTEAKVVVDSDILTIADNAFAHNEHIESIEVKSLSLRTVGKEAFSGCKRLREAHFNAIKGGIGASAFEGCSRLSSFVIPNGAMEIGSRAFCGCAAHFVLQVPASVDVIGDKIVDRSAIIVSLKPNDEINRYVEKNNIAIRRDFNAVLKHLGTRELIERHGEYKQFSICGENISASNTLRIYQEVLEYYENEKQRLIDLAIDGLPTQLSLSAAQQQAITDILNSLQDGTKTLISRVERWGVILPDSTAFPDALLPMVKLAKCANLIIQGLTEGKKAANEMIEDARSALADEAESRVTGLSYGMIGGGLDMVLYSIDDFRERQRQRRAAYAEADIKLQQYASKTNNLANQQFAALMKDTAIPTFLATITECCEALRTAELDTLRGEGILLGNEPELDDIAKSAKIIESALSDTSRDKEYSIALALKKCPFNKGAYSLAAGNGLVSDELFALAAHIGMGDEILENISPEFSLVEKMAQSKAVTIDGLAEFCSNVTIFGGKMPDRVAAIIKTKLINLLKAHVCADLNTQYDGHNQKAIEESAVKSAVACVSKKSAAKLNSAGISVIDCASLIAKEKIQEDRADVYALTLSFINESQSIPESVARIKEIEAALGNSSTIELLQACITCCDKKLVSLAADYASRDIQPDAGELEDRVLGIIGDSDLDYIRSKGCSVLRSSPFSIEDLTEILLKRIESTRIKNAADEKKYVEACRLQEAAQSAKDYEAVAALFDELTLYKDSTARQIECIKKQQEIQEKEYADAADALKSAKTKKALDEVSTQFAAISDYKDSKSLLKEIESKKRSKRNKTIGLFLCFALLIVGVGMFIGYRFVILPNHYKNGQAALANGDYITAIHEFSSSKTYADTEALLQRIIDEHPDAYRASLDIGQVFAFGTYNGEPIEWVVLEKNGTQTLVISKDILCRKPFNYTLSVDPRPATWSSSTLRGWLNGEFFSTSFSDDEAQLIQTTTVITEDRTVKMTYPVAFDHVVSGGGITSDKIFLLSQEEANKYMSHIPSTDGVWWLRDPGDSSTKTVVVRNFTINSAGITNHCGGGYYSTDEDWKNNTVYGPRPAMWLDLSYNN